MAVANGAIEISSPRLSDRAALGGSIIVPSSFIALRECHPRISALAPAANERDSRYLLGKVQAGV